MALKLWLRTETKTGERRSPLAPQHAAELVKAGVSLTVERSVRRIFPDEQYRREGAVLAEPGSWVSAPPDAYILGLKELPDGDQPLKHKHVFFAHAYKGQAGSLALLAPRNDSGA